MLQITCDSCGKKLRAGDDHHVVKIEVFAATHSAVLSEADLEQDHMEVVSQLLQNLDDMEEPDELEAETKNRRYDLCPRCCKRYLRDPLGREASQKFDFSEN